MRAEVLRRLIFDGRALTRQLLKRFGSGGLTTQLREWAYEAR